MENLLIVSGKTFELVILPKLFKTSIFHVISSSSAPQSKKVFVNIELVNCFIETKNLDGETNMKFKSANKTVGKLFKNPEDVVIY